jgi:hypothetical protein
MNDRTRSSHSVCLSDIVKSMGRSSPLFRNLVPDFVTAIGAPQADCLGRPRLPEIPPRGITRLTFPALKR